MCTPTLLQQLTEYLNQAETLADDALVKARLERIALSLDYTKRMVNVFRERDATKAATGSTPPSTSGAPICS